MFSNRLTSVVIALLVATPLRAQTPAIVPAAVQWLENHSTLERRIGLAEVQRVHNSRRADIEELQKIAATAEVQELLCWRMLPVAPAQRDEFRQQLSKLKTLDPQNRWVPVWELYLLSGEANRAPFVAAILHAPALTPERFPAGRAETAHLELLRELGVPRVQAGVEVISARSHEPLHALRDLDRAITREAEFADSDDRKADAKRIRARRDEYRRAYLKASKHLVEKLFALRLLGASEERDALLAKARMLPYLHDRNRLASLLQRLEEEKAWARLIEPLLAGELALIENPPDFVDVQASAVAQMQIKAGTKSLQDKTVRYEGDVRLRLAGIEILCKELTLLPSDDPAAVLVSGSGGVQLHGFIDYPGGIVADRFSFHAETGAFTLGGDIRLHRREKTVKLRACTLTQGGELRDSRSLIDDFRASFTIEARLALLPKIAKVYADTELPDEVRYVFALNLLRPHLSWHAPYLPPLPDREGKYKQIDELTQVREWPRTGAWQAALGGEAWMLDDIPQARVDQFRASVRAWYKQFNADPRSQHIEAPDLPQPAKDLYFWRLDDPAHPDVARAIHLLQGFAAGELGGKANRWISELRRNNTVVTFDIAGAAPIGRKHSLLMDVRNAESVAFKLYRLHDPRELVFATRNIGKDFIYRQHDLDDQHVKTSLRFDEEKIFRTREVHEMRALSRDDAFKPAWKKEQLVRAWTERVADLPHRPSERERWRSCRHRRDDDWHDESDAHYFDDVCSQHRPRIDKAYRPHRKERLSSWQCDRVVQIPANVLAEAGAYVLVAEANGQAAHVPIVVEPVSLTLRRCRDGVFVLASDAEGKKPLADAKIHAFGQQGEAITDKEGAAFARVLAYGDRAIVVHHQGRYAIGGFGQVFEGIYDSDDDERHLFVFERLERARRADSKETSAHVYADQHVVAAYTDRPTYRPGQDVQFKLIVRKLVAEKAGAAIAASFRDDDFDVKTKMVLPVLEGNVAYAVLDPKGHEVAHGTLKLSEFGTAAGTLKLNGASVVGAYTMRVHLGGEPRIVPEVFAVQHYRRPNFEVRVTGVPEKLTKPETLALNVTSRYYFGPPIAGGVVDVRVVRKDFGKTVAEAQGKLDEQGRARIALKLPRALTSGTYVVVSSITDESGRTVKTTTPLTIESPNAPRGVSALDALPRFVAVGEEVKVATTAKEIRAAQDLTDLRFTSKNGVAMLKFAAPGWYRLKADEAEGEAMLFVYGGDKHPLTFADVENGAKNRVTRLHPSGWVNLSDYAWQDRGHISRWERPSQHLFALFDRQSLKVGAKLRFLVYVPHKNAKLLFTIEGRTVLDYVTMWSRDAGTYQIVEIPIKERYFPNVYVQGRILTQNADRVLHEVSKAYAKTKDIEIEDDEVADPGWCRIDVARAKGTLTEPALNVQIETDRANYRPGDSVRAIIKVTDRAGRPQAAEVSLAAIDESVFAFGEDNLDGLPGFFRMPYEARRFQPKVWRSSLGSQWTHQGGVDKVQKQVRDMATASEALQAQEAAIQRLEVARADLKEKQFVLAPLPRLGGEMPGKQIPLTHLREHFQETAAWLPQVRTDANGMAQAAFTLPDSLTRYRLTSLALTKTTEVGVGRAHVTAGLPLAVQVFLPRFAIEKDRLLAVALIHNHTGEARDCTFSWDVTGAVAEMPATGRVKVPANGSTKVGVWVRAEQIGTARIAFRAEAGKEIDAEVRTLPVQPLGKPAEINVNEKLAAFQIKPAEKVVAGKFEREGRVQLPAGFVARELHISLAASDLAQSLDGLDYLVDYPYGCIEQTMSRFLPVVMIKHATQQSPVKLQPDIAKKLPQILEQGLTRLYSHQHVDGSWGWFDKDSRNLAMSVYVVYGLARCQATGAKVDADVLRRGCDYLRDELRNGKHEEELVARAWYALALAGHADAKELKTWAAHALTRQPRPRSSANLALACRAAGLNELGEKAGAEVRGWQPHDTESLALLLNAQLAYGAPYRDCRATTDRLLARRHGTRWDHTRDTAWAIEAMSNMLGYIPDKALVRKIEIALAGKTILEIRDPAELKKLAWRVRLNAEQLPAQEALEIRLKADSDEPIHVAVRAAGVQRQDEALASGQHIKLQRVLETLEGQPVRGPLKVGQVVRVRLKLDLQQDVEYLLIEERRPALCEFADDRIAGPSAKSAVHQEFRDDRLCVFYTSLPAGAHEIVYYLRAETPGRCSVLSGCAYPMYDEKVRGETASSKIDVLER